MHRFDLRSGAVIRPAVRADLPGLEWNGEFWAHRALIHDAFERQQLDEVLMLTADVRGSPLGQVWVDFTRKPDAAVFWALRVHTSVQRLGLGAHLIHAAEVEAAERGFDTMELAVDPHNAAARRLYHRLGYADVGEETSRTRFQRPDGVEECMTDTHLLMRKALSPAQPGAQTSVRAATRS